MGLSDFILNRRCRGCGAQKTLLCGACRADVEAAIGPHRLVAGSLPTHSAVRYESTVRAVILAAKRTGSPECIAVMARLAQVALLQCIDEVGTESEVCIVPLHSGAKTRAGAGQDLVVAVLRQAVKGMRDSAVEDRVADVPQTRPHAVQQKLLNREERSSNVRGSVRVAARARLQGRSVVIFDDVMTSGATLRAASQAVGAVQGQVLAGVVVAHRPWISSDSGRQAGEWMTDD